MRALFSRSGLLLALLLAVASCAHERVVEGKTLHASKLTAVVRATALARNLPLRHELPVELVERDFVRHQMQSSVTGYVRPAALEAYQRLLKHLKLLPADFDAAQFAEGTVANRVAGYYDARGGVMRIVRREAPFGPLVGWAAAALGRDLAGEFLLAHELGHALADHNFDLAAYFMAVTNNADALLARQAFAEGDAQLTALAYVTGNRLRPVDFWPEASTAWRNPLKDWYAIPAAFRRAGLFLYLDGLEFAGAVYQRGGARGLNRVYVGPPRSTEEVLHPSKYFAGDDPPVEVRFAADPAELAGYRRIDENTLGELGTQALLIQSLGVCGAKQAAAGWGGDRYRVYRREGAAGGAGFAWKTVWDSPAERAEFTANLALALEKTFGVAPVAGGESLRWYTAEGTFTLRAEGDAGALLVFAGES